MQISELATRAGVTTKAVRYYESLGLPRPDRAANGYRVYDQTHLRIVREVRELTATGISASKAQPFVECLELGHEHSDECVSSMAAYRESIAEADRIIAAMRERRARLIARLEASASRSNQEETTMVDYTTLPSNLPKPEDDGAADHLAGSAMPELRLPTSDRSEVALDRLGPGRTIMYLYPLSGRPGVDLPDGWDAIPGARGCSTEACDFRDHLDLLREAGAARVFGLSSQSAEYQAELVERLRLPFEMISDERLQLADALKLPTFSAPGHDRLYSRLTLVLRDGRIEHAFYPIFPPNEHAQQVLDWLKEHQQ